MLQTAPKLDRDATTEERTVRHEINRTYGVLLPDDGGDISVSVECEFSTYDLNEGFPIDGYLLSADSDINPQERKDVEDLIRLDLKSAGYAGTGVFRWDGQVDGK